MMARSELVPSNEKEHYVQCIEDSASGLPRRTWSLSSDSVFLGCSTRRLVMLVKLRSPCEKGDRKPASDRKIKRERPRGKPRVSQHLRQ